MSEAEEKRSRITDAMDRRLEELEARPTPPPIRQVWCEGQGYGYGLGFRDGVDSERERSEALRRTAREVLVFIEARRVTLYGAADAFREQLRHLEDALDD